MKLGSLVFISCAAVAALVGCGQAAVSSTGPQEIALVPAAAGMPMVQAGVAFDAQLDNALDTRLTRPGAPFTATLLESLVDVEGHVLVPSGARITGTVASTGPVEAPHLELHFRQIVSPNGSAPLDVRIVSAETQRYQAWSSPPGYAGAEGMLSSMPQAYAQRAAFAYSPPGTMPILMRKGAKMRLELTRPLFFRAARNE